MDFKEPILPSLVRGRLPRLVYVENGYLALQICLGNTQFGSPATFQLESVESIELQHPKRRVSQLVIGYTGNRVIKLFVDEKHEKSKLIDDLKSAILYELQSHKEQDLSLINETQKLIDQLSPDYNYIRGSTANQLKAIVSASSLKRATRRSLKLLNHPLYDIPANELELIDKLSTLQQVILDTTNFVSQRNQEFIQKESLRFKSLFDSIESNPLTIPQRIACVTDDDNNLVLAGAGTGKTSTMVGKAGYLVAAGKAKPNEILMLAFGNKAKEELQERISEKLNSNDIKASTFHALGKDIIASAEKKKPSISPLATDAALLKKFVDTAFNDLLSDKKYSKKAIKYFDNYLYPAKNSFDFKSQGEYFDFLESNDIRTLKGEKVKSFEECIIANLFFTHGIEYVYEAPYEHSTATTQFSQYKPDFFIPEYNIYIEHFGIDRKGKTAPWIDSTKYRQEMEWKRNLHRENKTVLIESFHYENSEGNLKDNLLINLQKYGVPIKPIPENSYLETLREFGSLTSFSILLSELLSNIKNTCRSNQEILNKVEQSTDKAHSHAALDLVLPIYEKYNQHLESEQSIDFNDMIHKAIVYVDEGRFIPPWKYILVDEFQDISAQRANLVKAIKKHRTDSSLFCVGDDWQAIFRFTGSDLTYTTQFEKKFGHTSITKLDKTFRFNNSICDTASKFVTANPNQINKKLTTHDVVDKPAVSILRSENSSAKEHVESALSRVNDLTAKNASVYIIGRYKYFSKNLDLPQLKRQYSKLPIEYHTMHASKGKEADYVIIIGLEKGKFGFPSEKTTHPLLETYLPALESMPHAEERRLFYVALTRAKKRAYVIANMSKASTFMTELLADSSYDLCLSEFNTPTTQLEAEQLHCPQCTTGNLVNRRSQQGRVFSGCTHYPRCNYTSSNCKKCGSPVKVSGRLRECVSCHFKTPICPICQRDMALRKNGSTGNSFWGCTGYRRNDPNSCGHSENYIDLNG